MEHFSFVYFSKDSQQHMSSMLYGIWRRRIRVELSGTFICTQNDLKNSDKLSMLIPKRKQRYKLLICILVTERAPCIS